LKNKENNTGEQITFALKKSEYGTSAEGVYMEFRNI
jgi:hypothetical protein